MEQDVATAWWLEKSGHAALTKSLYTLVRDREEAIAASLPTHQRINKSPTEERKIQECQTTGQFHRLLLLQ
jgi:hypothetical protein